MSEPSTSPHRGPDLTPAEVLAAHAEGGVLLLDVREPDEWDGGHAAGATHIPLGDLDPTQLDPAVPVIAICRSGNRSGKAADKLAAAGIEVRNMAGGMNVWQDLGLPVVRDDGTPGTIG